MTLFTFQDRERKVQAAARLFHLLGSNTGITLALGRSALRAQAASERRERWSTFRTISGLIASLSSLRLERSPAIFLISPPSGEGHYIP